MKKKESLWDLLTRLDEQAGQFNAHIHKANQYFDTTASTTQNILDKHEKDLHKLIVKVRRSLKDFMKEKEKEKEKDKGK